MNAIYAILILGLESSSRVLFEITTRLDGFILWLKAIRHSRNTRSQLEKYDRETTIS